MTFAHLTSKGFTESLHRASAEYYMAAITEYENIVFDSYYMIPFTNKLSI